jgi:hypothetical protein
LVHRAPPTTALSIMLPTVVDNVFVRVYFNVRTY